jgi:hypothetical protein
MEDAVAELTGQSADETSEVNTVSRARRTWANNFSNAFENVLQADGLKFDFNRPRSLTVAA